MRILTDDVLTKTLEYWQSELTYAEYVCDGETFKVPLTRNEVDYENKRLILDFNMNNDIENDANITKVSWFDSNGNLWAESKENIIREFYYEGVLYRLILYIQEDEG